MSSFGKTTYEELCAAAGLVGPVVDGPEIMLCIGTSAEIEKPQQKLAPGAGRTRKWRWRYHWDNKARAYRAYVFLVIERADDPDDRRLVFRGLAAVFGCPGLSDEFRESVFDKKSKADRLDEIDRQLMRLLYQHIANGAGKESILAAVDKNWAEMVMPPAGDETDGSKL
jgi:hypothetical protein